MYNTFSISHSLLLFFIQCSHFIGSLWASLWNLISNSVFILPFKVVAVQQQLWRRTYPVPPEGRYSIETSCQLGGNGTFRMPVQLQKAFSVLNGVPQHAMSPHGGFCVFSGNHCDRFGCRVSEGACQPNLAIGLKGENRSREHVSGPCKQAFAHLTLTASSFHRGMGEVKRLAQHHVISEGHN